MLDQHNRGTQLAEPLWTGELLAMAVGHVKNIVHTMTGRIHGNLADVDARQSQRIGELVQEAGRVEGADVQDRVSVGGLVVNIEIDRVKVGPEVASGSARATGPRQLASLPCASRWRPALSRRSNPVRSSA